MISDLGKSYIQFNDGSRSQSPLPRHSPSQSSPFPEGSFAHARCSHGAERNSRNGDISPSALRCPCPCLAGVRWVALPFCSEWKICMCVRSLKAFWAVFLGSSKMHVCVRVCVWMAWLGLERGGKSTLSARGYGYTRDDGGVAVVVLEDGMGCDGDAMRCCRS